MVSRIQINIVTDYINNKTLDNAGCVIEGFFYVTKLKCKCKVK